MDWILRRLKRGWLRVVVFGGIVLSIAASETLVNAPVFSSRYNFFHMNGR